MFCCNHKYLLKNTVFRRRATFLLLLIDAVGIGVFIGFLIFHRPLASQDKYMPTAEDTNDSELDRIESKEIKSEDNNTDKQNQLIYREYKRIRNYEALLRKKASILDAIISDAEKLDFDFSEKGLTESLAPEAKITSKNSPDIGGGDSTRSPFFHLRKDSASKKNEKTIPLLLSELDLKITKFSRLPLGAPVQGAVSSGFGIRVSPFHRGLHLHEGVDFSAEKESQVVATADGIVVNAGYKGAYGNCVIIKHGKRIETLYGHLSKISVKLGQRVCRGQQLGLVGLTGRTTGPHVHYEVRVDAEAINPNRFVQLASFLRLLGTNG